MSGAPQITTRLIQCNRNGQKPKAGCQHTSMGLKQEGCTGASLLGCSQPLCLLAASPALACERAALKRQAPAPPASSKPGAQPPCLCACLGQGAWPPPSLHAAARRQEAKPGAGGQKRGAGGSQREASSHVSSGPLKRQGSPPPPAQGFE